MFTAVYMADSVFVLLTKKWFLKKVGVGSKIGFSCIFIKIIHEYYRILFCETIDLTPQISSAIEFTRSDIRCIMDGWFEIRKQSGKLLKVKLFHSGWDMKLFKQNFQIKAMLI